MNHPIYAVAVMRDDIDMTKLVAALLDLLRAEREPAADSDASDTSAGAA